MSYEELLNKYNKLLEAYTRLEYENTLLRKRLGNSLVKEEINQYQNPIRTLNKYSSIEDKLQLFMSLFTGRKDVYAKRWESRDGKCGYTPVCANEWKVGVCNKKIIKCDKCLHRKLVVLDSKAIENHLRGLDEKGRDVVGLYPLLEDNQCYLLAIDFDKKEWKKDVAAFRTTCKEIGLEIAVEISRSGNGAHVWIFFSSKIPAVTARRLGTLLLSYAMNMRHEIGFESYDRLFPNQDTMPKGGFGNLIALPLQGKARKDGNSLFVNDSFKPYIDQWEYLSQIKKLSAQEIDEIVDKLNKEVGREINNNMEEEGEFLKKVTLSKNDVPTQINIIKSNMLYLDKKGFSPKAINQLKRMAAFNNPDFFKAQAMRMPTYNKPRIIYGFDETEKTLILPRGCEEKLLEVVKRNNIEVIIKDQRTKGRSIDVIFNGQLKEEQVPAALEMLNHDNGILAATTAFGKTVIGAYLIANRKVNTLILVHNKQLLNQWKDRLQQFLIINEEISEKSSGNRKVKGIIGEICGGKNRANGVIDVAMIQTLTKKENMKELIKNYGMIIVDECHHISAFSFEQVIKEAIATYVYGLTATPTRQDGHHPLIFMQCGPIRYKVDAKKQAKERAFEHLLIPRFTPFKMVSESAGEKYGINTIYKYLCESEIRNSLIIGDILQALEKGRTPIVISERTEHVQNLADKLSGKCKNIIVLTGKLKNKERLDIVSKMQAIPANEEMIILATGKYVGEGFDFPRLDTLFLAMPISWKGTLAQYAGRLHRSYENKKDVLIYDYVDIHVGTLEKMYHKRVRGYTSIGYKIWGDLSSRVTQNIFEKENYIQTYYQDITDSIKSIMIVSPSISKTKILTLRDYIAEKCVFGIKVQIITKPLNAYKEVSRTTLKKILNELENMGCTIVYKDNLYQKFAIIDERLVWYGSIHLLGYNQETETMMRIDSMEIAKELKETIKE